jgi:competence protein ComEC
MQRPLFLSLLVFIAGVSLSIILIAEVGLHSILTDKFELLIMFIIAVIIGSLIRFRRTKDISTVWLLMIIFIIGLIYGVFRLELDERHSEYKDRENITVIGTISNAWSTPNYYALLIGTQAKEILQVQIYKRDIAEQNTQIDLYPGQIIEIAGEYRLPSVKRNIGGFDEQRYFWINNWDGKIGTYIDQVTVIGEQKTAKYLLAKILHKSKNYYQSLIRKAMNDREYAVINALVLGDRAYMDSDTKELIRKLGLSHLFAISGLHVGIIIITFIIILDRLFISREKTYLILLLLLPIYALIIGGTPSVVRSVFMAELMLLAMLIKKKSDIYTNLMIAAFIIILFSPKTLLSVGFQLTFLITYGIVLFEPIINELLLKLRIRWNSLRKLIAITIAAQIFAFPLLVFYFREFAWSVVVSQYVVLQIISIFILPAGIVLLLIAWIHPALAVIPTYILQQAAKYMLLITDKMSFATTYVSVFSEISWVWVVLYICLVLIFAYFMYYKRYATRIILTCAGALLVLVLLLWMPKLPTGNLHITMIDIGQGDAIHIETPKGKHILIDGGGYPQYYENDYDVGLKILIPYLQAKGIRELDIVFLSHGDFDHIGGLHTVLNSFPVKSFIYSIEDSREAFKQLIDIATNKDINIYQVGKGDRIEIEQDLIIDILHPDITVATNESTNDNSMVKLLKYLDTFVLFTGDIEQKTEQALSAELREHNIDILKVAHHGSRTSSSQALLDAISPKYALISVGNNNNFGHPNEDVLDRLMNTCRAVYRTDQHGAISIIIEDNAMHFETMIE